MTNIKSRNYLEQILVIYDDFHIITTIILKYFYIRAGHTKLTLCQQLI